MDERLGSLTWYTPPGCRPLAGGLDGVNCRTE